MSVFFWISTSVEIVIIVCLLVPCLFGLYHECKRAKYQEARLDEESECQIDISIEDVA